MFCHFVIIFCISDVDCKVQTSTTTEIQCKLDIPNDTEPGVILPASVRVDNLGQAALHITGELLKGYKLIPSITSLSYQAGSLMGGQLLTIYGKVGIIQTLFFDKTF